MMIRHTKTAVTINLFVAIVVVMGYAICGLMVGLPIDRYFLTTAPSHLLTVADPSVPAWILPVLAEAAVLGAFIVLRRAELRMKEHRLVCMVIGVVGLYGLFVRMLPQYQEEHLSASFVRVDHILAHYVTYSHLVYAVFGPNEE